MVYSKTDFDLVNVIKSYDSWQHAACLCRAVTCRVCDRVLADQVIKPSAQVADQLPQVNALPASSFQYRNSQQAAER